MSFIIFVILLAVLILAHEFGHFIIAKKSGIRVDEFGLGFPPRMWGKKIGETVYSINWIPFGGFVKIFGENPDDESVEGTDKARSMVHKSKLTQIGVLAAGVTANVLLAWVLLTLGFMIGLPTAVENVSIGYVRDAALTITSIMPKSPASIAGFRAGDKILSMKAGTSTLSGTTVSALQSFIGSQGDNPLIVIVGRSGGNKEISVMPLEGVVAGKKGIGVGLAYVGMLQLTPWQAVVEGFSATKAMVEETTVGLGSFLWNAVRGKAEISQVTGPIGIVGMVGDASKLGFSFLITFAAMISINLAVINLFPFPALDGGRILFVIIEVIKRSPIKPKVANMFNAVGFFLLLALMAIVTVHDIIKMF